MRSSAGFTVERSPKCGSWVKQIAALAKRVAVGQAEEMPEKLNTPGKRALYNNLGHDEALALKIDETVRKTRPDGWRGV